jgi:hypothetical protein
VPDILDKKPSISNDSAEPDTPAQSSYLTDILSEEFVIVLQLVGGVLLIQAYVVAAAPVHIVKIAAAAVQNFFINLSFNKKTAKGNGGRGVQKIKHKYDPASLRTSLFYNWQPPGQAGFFPIKQKARTRQNLSGGCNAFYHIAYAWAF